MTIEDGAVLPNERRITSLARWTMTLLKALRERFGTRFVADGPRTATAC